MTETRSIGRLQRQILYFLARFAGPLGVLVQTFVFARIMPPDGSFAEFIELYSWAVVASTLSDFAMQNVLFGALRQPDITPPQQQEAFAGAVTVKLYASLVTAAAFFLWGLAYQQSHTLLAAALLGLTMPVGDIALIAIRGRFQPGV